MVPKKSQKGNFIKCALFVIETNDNEYIPLGIFRYFSVPDTSYGQFILMRGKYEISIPCKVGRYL